MERAHTLNPLSIQDENFAIHRKKIAVASKSKASKSVGEKGGIAPKNRKALNDITNKSSINHEASSPKKRSQNKKSNTVKESNLHHHGAEADTLSKKKSSTNEKLNIAEEGFLHDHSKCIEAQKTAHELNFWDTIFPGHDSSDLIMEQKKRGLDADNLNCQLELEELPMSDWFQTYWKSPPSSPIRCDSPTPSFFTWELELFEMVLKEDDSDNA